MKNIFLSLSLLFVFINQLNAIDIPGYYISNTNDSVKVTFRIPIDNYDDEIDFDQLQWKVKYYDSTGRKKVLDAAVTKEIGFSYGMKTIKMVVCKNDIGLSAGLGNNFRAYLCQVIDGKIKLYKYYKTIKMGGGYGGMTPTGPISTGGGGQYVKKIEQYVTQKENGKLFRPSQNRFQEEMVKYLADCPTVVKKIEDKIYTIEYIEALVNEYNKVCK